MCLYNILSIKFIFHKRDLSICIIPTLKSLFRCDTPPLKFRLGHFDGSSKSTSPTYKVKVFASFEFKVQLWLLQIVQCEGIHVLCVCVCVCVFFFFFLFFSSTGIYLPTSPEEVSCHTKSTVSGTATKSLNQKKQFHTLWPF